jgi:hypothetical protein
MSSKSSTAATPGRHAGPADAAVVHLDDLFIPVLHQQFVVNAGFAKLVFNHGNAVAVVGLEDAVEQRGFAAAQKTGEDSDGKAGVSQGVDP